MVCKQIGNIHINSISYLSFAQSNGDMLLGE
jgi:hypothetical protein